MWHQLRVVSLSSQVLIMAMIMSFETGLISGHNGFCLVSGLELPPFEH